MKTRYYVAVLSLCLLTVAFTAQSTQSQAQVNTGEQRGLVKQKGLRSLAELALRVHLQFRSQTPFEQSAKRDERVARMVPVTRESAPTQNVEILKMLFNVTELKRRN